MAVPHNQLCRWAEERPCRDEGVGDPADAEAAVLQKRTAPITLVRHVLNAMMGGLAPTAERTTEPAGARITAQSLRYQPRSENRI